VSLADRIGARDREIFVGRRNEQDALDRFLRPGSPHHVLFVTGPGGVGKSALLRRLVQRARQDGYEVVTADARQLAPDSAALDAALAPALRSERPLVVLDTYEALEALDSPLREEVLPALPERGRVVIASRNPPDPAWLASAWGSSILRVPLAPFSDEDARACLAARGVDEQVVVERILPWAAGLPLALALAATVVAGADADLVPGSLDGELLDHLTGAELDGADRDVLSVAALTNAVDADLIGAVLPGVDGAAAEHWLRGLTFSERLGSRVTLHAQVRRLLTAEVQRTEPAVERRLRLRIIDALADAAMARDPALVADMRDLLSAAEDQGATSSEAALTLRVEQPHGTEGPAIRALLDGRDPAYVDWVVHWVEHAPEQVLLIRDGKDVAAVALWATPARRPAFADPVVDSWVARVRALDDGANALFSLTTEVLASPERLPEIVALGNATLISRSRLPNLRWWLLGQTPGLPGDPAAFGAGRETALDHRFGSELLRGFAIDYGPDGVIGALRARAHAELGPAAGDHGRADPADVRDAFRVLHQPVALAAHPLAVGRGVEERAASVRTRLVDAVDRAFGDSEAEQVQRSVLELGYLDPLGGHARAMHTLHLSRTTYFRRLREATARVAAYLQL
jgi:hypothetical protein